MPLSENINDAQMGWDLHTASTTQNDSVVEERTATRTIAKSNLNKDSLRLIYYQFLACPSDNPYNATKQSQM